MSKYDKLKKVNESQKAVEALQFKQVRQGLDEIIEDANRTVSVYHNAENYLEDIDKQFEVATGFDKKDVAFLLLATALQVGRWVVLGEINGILSDKIKESRVAHDDKSIKDMEKEKRSDYEERHTNNKNIEKEEHRGWVSIISDSVPYDITKGSKDLGVNMGAGRHRIHTLGHDPVLGWIFGTMNILSDTITLDKTHMLRTFNVQMMKKPKMWTTETNMVSGFKKAYKSIQEDHNRLPAAVFAQAIHLKSDAFTKVGLPVPLLEAFVPDFASKLYKESYDSLCLMKDIAVVGAQAVVSAVINMLISLIHGLYYDPSSCPNRDIYEVKTRKILMWSNIIASSSNVVAVAGMETAAYFTENPELAKKGLQYLDIGGYIVTMYRLVSDTKFIHKVKKEFLEKEWNKLVVGDEYKFISEENNYE